MRKLFSALMCIVAVTMLTSTSCERKESNIAGKGGKATLKVTPQHHGKNIDSCTVSLKYNTQDKPTTAYDETVKCVMENGKPVATFSELKPGNYYLYGNGWDKNISQNVEGGIPYTIGEEKTYEINVPVTEAGH